MTRPARLNPVPACWAKYPGGRERTNWFLDQHHAWQTQPMTPMRVTAHLDGGYIPTTLDGGVHLDALIASAVVSDAPRATHFGVTPVIIPVPLAILTTLPGPTGETLPLWAATTLAPLEARNAAAYQHKRYPADRAHLGRMDRAIDTRTGQHKDRRTPHPITLTPQVTGIAIGHPEEAQRLLDAHVPNVGKRHHAGFGRVLRWRVEPLTFTRDETIAIITASRAIPNRAQALIPDHGRTETVTWTPPYWYSPWAEPCRTP